MRASVLLDVNRLEVREVPGPQIGSNDVLIRTSAVGLCGTDLHIFSGEANYNTDERGRPIPLSTQPQILGHEVSGVIEETGKDVGKLKLGDRVIFDQGLSCVSARRPTRCEYCSTGDSHQCELYGELGITGLPGGLAEFVSIPAVNTVRLESDLNLNEAALSEPLACVVHCLSMIERATGARYLLSGEDVKRRIKGVLIIGAGPAGLLFTQYLLNVIGFNGQLFVSEPNRRKRDLASGFGAQVVDPSTTDLIEFVAEKTQGSKVELLIDASGIGDLFPLIPGLVRKQSTLALYGHGHRGVDLSILNAIQFLEPTIVSPVGGSGGFEPDGTPSSYLRALRLLEAGTVKVAPFITHRYSSLEGVHQALTHDYYQRDYIKGIVTL